MSAKRQRDSSISSKQGPQKFDCSRFDIVLSLPIAKEHTAVVRRGSQSRVCQRMRGEWLDFLEPIRQEGQNGGDTFFKVAASDGRMLLLLTEARSRSGRPVARVAEATRETSGPLMRPTESERG